MGLSQDAMLQQYTGAPATFAGTDIMAYGQIGTHKFFLGTISGLTVNTVREKGLAYAIGRSDPVAVARGKRACSGTISFLTFHREAASIIAEQIQTGLQKDGYGSVTMGYSSLLNRPMTQSGTDPSSIDSGQYLAQAFSTTGGLQNTISDNAYRRVQSNLDNGGIGFGAFNANNYMEWVQHPDQLYPITLHLIGANEYGTGIEKYIYGVEFTGNGTSISINDIIIETPYSYIALGESPIKPINFSASSAASSTISSIGNSYTNVGQFGTGVSNI